MAKIMRRVLVMTCVVALILSLSGSALANFNVTVKPLASIYEDEVYSGATGEIGYRVLDCLDLYVGYAYYRDYDQDDDGDNWWLWTATFATLGARYYFARLGDVETFVFGSYGIGRELWAAYYNTEGEEDHWYRYRLGLGAAYNLSPNWAIVAETGYDGTKYSWDEGEQTYTRTFSEFGLKFSF